MIDRALGFTAPESYYFQLYPVNLILLQEPVPSPDSKFKFSIYKGMQKFDENKIMTDANFIDSNGTFIMPFRGSQLNFYVPNFNANRKTTFTLKLNEKQANQEYDLGGIDIDPAIYIADFKEKTQTRFEQKVEISEQYAIEFEIYLEKSRFALEKIVKSFKNERTLKSPVRQRKSPIQQRKSPVAEDVRSPISETRTPVQDRKTSRVQQKAPEPVEEPVAEKSASKSRSRVLEKSPVKQQKVEVKEQVIVEKPVQKKPEPTVQESRSKAVKKETSVKSESIVEPMVKSKQVKRSGGNETTIRGSQKGVQEEHVPVVKTAKDEDNWTNHLKLIAFTIVGVVLIYIVMHPNSKV